VLRISTSSLGASCPGLALPSSPPMSAGRFVNVAGEQVRLSAKQYELLVALARIPRTDFATTLLQRKMEAAGIEPAAVKTSGSPRRTAA